MGLPPEDARRLVELCSAFPVAKAVFTFAPAAGLLRSLRRAHPGLEHRVLEGEAGADLRSWLSPGSDEGGHMRSIPDFGFTPGNEAARLMPPLAFIVGGDECLYRRSVRGNPAYAGVDLSGCRAEGCAFCVSGGKSSSGSGPTLADALAQARAFYATYPFAPGGARPRLRLAGQLLLREAEAMAEGVAALGGPGTDLLLDGRVDVLLKQEGRLRAAAARLRGTGHKLHVCLVGLENFSAPELQRLNKGVTAAQNLAAVRMLRRLESELPEEFGFEEHGGLSTIFFSPWTSLEDLALNFALVRHFRLERACGKLLTSRVRLYEGLPLTALARRDGLLVRRYADPALDTAGRNFYPDELPWRFRHREVEPVGRVATRMASAEALGRDPLAARVRRWRGEQRAAGLSETDSVLGLLDRALGSPSPLRPEELLRQPRSRARSEPESGVWDPSEQAALTLRLHKAGLMRASRLEGVSEARARALESELGRAGSSARAARRPKASGPGAWDVFFGPKADDVEEALRLTRVQYSGAGAEELAEAKRRIGALYGYPECCSRAFSQLSSSSPHMNEWLLLLRRCEEPGRVDPLLNPFRGVINYVPCSLRCEASLDRAKAVLRALGPRRRDFPAAARARPVLFLLDRIGEFLELAPKGRAGRVFAFEGGELQGSDPALRAAAAGGELSVAPGLVTVRAGGRRRACFALRAAVWWHEEAFDADFWSLCALELLERRAEPAPAAPAGEAPRPAAAPVAPAAPASEALAARLRARLKAGGTLARYRVRSVEAGCGRFAVVRLEGEDGPLCVHVEPREGAGPHYKAAGGFAFGYSDATPLRSAAQLEAFDALMGLLGGAA